MSENRALVASGIVQPLVTVEEAVEAWHGYLRLCDALLTPKDYVDIRNRKYRTKSGWRKLARAFNIADEIVDKEIVVDELARVVSAAFVVRAIAPNGRSVEAWASCSIAERAHEEDKEDRWGNICAGSCDGRKHFNNPNHDIPATAHTRAKNRGIADLIGAGEVSFEEMQTEELRREEEREPQVPGAQIVEEPPKKKRRRSTPRTKATNKKGKNKGPVPRPASFTESPADPAGPEWKWLTQELEKAGVSQQEAIACIGHTTVGHWHQAEPGRTLAEALIEILSVAGKGAPVAESPPEEAELPQPGDVITTEEIPF